MEEQKIIVRGHRLEMWETTLDGGRKRILRCYCGYGRNGYAVKKREGDGCTPVGVFPLEMAFGLAPNPGTALPWRDVTPSSFWSGDKENYNTWQESPCKEGERLADYPVQYKYAAVIGYNTLEPRYGAGSAIFLHCYGPRKSWFQCRSSRTATAGCISVPEYVMVRLLKVLRPGAVIDIQG
ncbi:MAG: L,D-transpeptidase family protein [Bacteroidales bacterium]|nr:L,D-transpeptidase family protein [Bacteroidales bacterium]